jgi:hypothetical protein
MPVSHGPAPAPPAARSPRPPILNKGQHHLPLPLARPLLMGVLTRGLETQRQYEQPCAISGAQVASGSDLLHPLTPAMQQ